MQNSLISKTFLTGTIAQTVPAGSNEPLRKKSVKYANKQKEIKAVAANSVAVAQTSSTLEISKNITLKPHGILIHTSFSRTGSVQSEKSRANLLGSNKKEYNGYMSDATSRYVKRITENWLTSIELTNGLDYKKKESYNNITVTFVTLTLPFKQLHHDNTIKNDCLDPMLEFLRKKYHVNCYLWRAEAQKNGHIHFHLIIDRFINHQIIRNKWNSLLNRLGYVQFYQGLQKMIYKDGFFVRKEQAEEQKQKIAYIIHRCIEDNSLVPDTRYVDTPTVRNAMNIFIMDQQKQQLKDKLRKPVELSDDFLSDLVVRLQYQAYQKGLSENWQNPNTTDIHKLNSIHSISAYITKYVSKSDFKKPKLSKNQRFVGGYVHTLKEGGSWSNAADYEEEKFEQSFESRKVRGRIWGKSSNLSDSSEGKQIEPPKYNYETVYLMRDTDSKGKTVFSEYKTGTQIGLEVYDYAMEVKKKIPEEKMKEIDEAMEAIFPLPEKYEHLTGKEREEKKTCRVIPLGKYIKTYDSKKKKKVKRFVSIKQISFLQQLSPKLQKVYLVHYEEIFYKLYPDRKAG